jgi:hypothetical protein
MEWICRPPVALGEDRAGCAAGGYAGLIFTHGLGWALLNVVASGLSPVSLWLLGMSFFLRLALAMTVGAEVLGDHEVLGGCGCCRCGTWWRWACG